MEISNYILKNLRIVILRLQVNEKVGTGVTEFDNAFNNLLSFIKGIARGLGLIWLIYGGLKLAASFNSQDPRERRDGIKSFIAGLLVLFLPEIVNFIVPGTF